MISVSEAEALISQLLPSPQPIARALENSLGYYLAMPIHAERDIPPFDRITHDGIAVDSLTMSRFFPVQSYAAAGMPQSELAQAGHCIEVATGAPLPKGCDTVIPYESLSLKDAIATLNADTKVKPRSCIHFQASDAKKGQELLSPGTLIGIPEIAILAGNGIAEVPVYARPSIGILATGDELVSVSAPVAPHQIRRSNDLTLAAALTSNGFTDVETGWVPDKKEAITARLAAWLGEKDVIVITGGVSRGSYDYVPEILQGLGVSMRLHHVAQRPGKPLWFGVSATGKPVFGLPGNPASCLICLIRYVLPALRHMSGAPMQSPHSTHLTKYFTANETLTLFIPVTLRGNMQSAAPLSTHGSGDFISLRGSTGFVQLPARSGSYITGEAVDYYPWKTL